MSAGTPDLSVLIPAYFESENLAVLVPELRTALEALQIRYELLIIVPGPDPETSAVASRYGATVVVQSAPGYGGALQSGFRRARGEFILTMDGDLSHEPVFVRDLWESRHETDVAVASRYVRGGSAEMSFSRKVLSRTLNVVFSRGLSLRTRDMSSGFRLYRAEVLDGCELRGRDFNVLQEILVHALGEGWRIREVPFAYAARQHGRSHARVIQFGIAYAKTFWSLWRRRNALESADYEDRAYDGPIPLQRYWQRTRVRNLIEFITGQGPVLDVGCGSSRIIAALPPGSVALDSSFPKLRYGRKFGKPLVCASATALPFSDETFPCVLCAQVIEHVPKDSPILDELCRVLAPGGRLVLSTPDYDRWEWRVLETLYRRFAPGGETDIHIARYTRRELVERFQARGFTLEATRYVMGAEVTLAFRKDAPAL
jgi:dolichol-phosphate mannosyltransferase